MVLYSLTVNADWYDTLSCSVLIGQTLSRATCSLGRPSLTLSAGWSDSLTLSADWSDSLTLCTDWSDPLSLSADWARGGAHLAEAAVADAAGELLDLGHLVGHTLLLVQLLRQALQLGEGQLQGQPVAVAPRRVLQHVLIGRGQEGALLTPTAHYLTM